MAPEQVSISYPGYVTASRVLFDSLVSNDDFTDVTLVCDDERIIKAHKLILCAFSQFFKNILLKISSPNPVIYISGIDFKDVQCILQFIYKGETQVEDSRVDSFLRSAEKLKINGIYPVAQFEQKKLSNLSQICPGVFTEEFNARHDNINYSPTTDIGDLLNVVIKEEPQDEMEEDDHPKIVAETEEISVKSENIEVSDHQPENVQEKIQLENMDSEPRIKEEIIGKLNIVNPMIINNRTRNYDKGSSIVNPKAMNNDGNVSQTSQNKCGMEAPLLTPTSMQKARKFRSPKIILEAKAGIQESPSRHLTGKEKLENPLSSSKGKLVLKCDHCHFKTVKYLLLKKHAQKIHSGSPHSQANITCNYCGSKFWSVEALNVHKTGVHNVIRA